MWNPLAFLIGAYAQSEQKRLTTYKPIPAGRK